MRYADFAELASEYFGLDNVEARELLAQIEDRGGTIRGIDADDKDFWAELANSDAFDAVLGVESSEDEYEELYELDPYFPDDGYLDAGDEWEITAEGYGEST